MARHDAVCVLHTHTVAGVAVSSVQEGVLPLNQWSAQFFGRVAFHDYEGIALDLDERARIVADLGDRFVMMLRNHGTLLLGRSVAEAMKLALNLERSCKAQIAALGMGLTPVVLSDEVAEHTARQYQSAYDGVENGNKPDPEWAAMLRRLDRAAPDYKD
jgi:ribulose-5-phosphate 4-epimerase/fuculose-1-phosphate aldolase